MSNLKLTYFRLAIYDFLVEIHVTIVAIEMNMSTSLWINIKVMFNKLKNKSTATYSKLWCVF